MRVFTVSPYQASPAFQGKSPFRREADVLYQVYCGKSYHELRNLEAALKREMSKADTAEFAVFQGYETPKEKRTTHTARKGSLNPEIRIQQSALSRALAGVSKKEADSLRPYEDAVLKVLQYCAGNRGYVRKQKLPKVVAQYGVPYDPEKTRRAAGRLIDQGKIRGGKHAYQYITDNR